MKRIAVILSLGVLFIAGIADAHVTVKPDQVGIGKYQTFTISVPVEKNMPASGLKLAIPDGVTSVSPTVKPGWNISLTKTGDVVTEIVWTGSLIPIGFRDEFTFSAKVPATATTITWKAYQTYQDGSVVAWELSPDQDQPKTSDGKSDFSKHGPASQTKIVDDLSNTADVASNSDKGKDDVANFSFVVSIIALLVSAYVFYQSKVK